MATINLNNSIKHHPPASHLPTILCDVAVPADVAPAVATARPQARVVSGGLFALPHGQKWEIPGMGLAKAEAYVCVVETLLLGLHNVQEHFSYGSLEVHKVRQIQAMSQQHAFKLIL